MGYCKRCHTEFVMNWRAINTDPTLRLDDKQIILKCQVAVYDPDSSGEPRMRVWDCEKREHKFYNLKEFAKLRAQGKYL